MNSSKSSKSSPTYTLTFGGVAYQSFNLLANAERAFHKATLTNTEKAVYRFRNIQRPVNSNLSLNQISGNHTIGLLKKNLKTLKKSV